MTNKFFTCVVTAFSALAILGGSACSKTQDISEEPVRPWDRQAMSTYIYMDFQSVDSAFIDRIDFENFDNVYLIDRDKWTSQENFDSTIDSILVTGGRAFPLPDAAEYSYAVQKAGEVGTRVLLCMGNDTRYAACDSVRRPKFVEALTQVVDAYGMDGIDIDWEADLAPNLDKYTVLLEDLRASLDSLGTVRNRKYYLTTALSFRSPFDDGLRKRIGDAVDWVNVMSYDAGGGVWGRIPTHNTPLQSISNAIDTIWAVVPREKLHLGLASYGFQYDNILPGEETGEGENLRNYGRFVNYNTVLPLIYNNPLWRAEYDPVEKMYYFINDKSRGFITVETPETLMHKYRLAADKGLGGTFWWEYNKDIIPAKDGSGKWSHTLIPEHKRKNSYKQ